MPTNSPVVMLRELDGGRHVPIWVGAPEATAIAYAHEGVTPPRPLTHDLAVDVLQQLGHRLTEVHITRMGEDMIFYAELVLDGSTKVDSRSSDAIALALRAEAPILVSEDVLDRVGVSLEDDDDELTDDEAAQLDAEPGVTSEAEVERFREFLDSVSAEDFEEPGGSAGSAGEKDSP